MLLFTKAGSSQFAFDRKRDRVISPQSSVKSGREKGVPLWEELPLEETRGKWVYPGGFHTPQSVRGRRVANTGLSWIVRYTLQEGVSRQSTVISRQ